MTDLMTAIRRLYALQDAIETIRGAWADDFPRPGDDLRVGLGDGQYVPLWKVLALLERLADEQIEVLAGCEAERRTGVA